MDEFTYNNAKNANIGHTSFELNCGYYPCIPFEKDINFYFQLKIADELSVELRELMIIYWENLHHAQKLQKKPTIKALNLEVTF